MSLIRSITHGVENLTAGARRSVARARLESEHRSLQRRHGQALQALGERVQELVVANALPDDGLGAHLAEVRNAEMLIAAKAAEIEQTRDQDEPPEG